ncbi:MAG: DUF1501 domain-containing protein [Deltaproteobacteria bacterium]|nr:DUF1501 domain-containing protein [Deltaproteobacteria bacterium]
MNNRREFIFKTAASLLTASLGNPVYLLGDTCSEPSVSIFIYLRGGADGLDMFQLVDEPRNSSLIDFLRNGRPNDQQSRQFARSELILPRSLTPQNPFCSQEVIPVTPTSQFGFHPAWERLRNFETVDPQLKPSRIKCDRFSSGHALDDFLIFRVMKGVGMLHFYPDIENVSLNDTRSNKSHFDTQAMSLLASVSAATGGRGFLGRAVYFGEPCNGNENLTNRLRLVGFGRYTNSELGGDSCRDVIRITGSLREFSMHEPITHLGFPETGCRSYRETHNPLVIDWGQNASELRSLISSLRSHRNNELAQMIIRAYEIAREADAVFHSMDNNTNLTIGTETDAEVRARFARYYYEFRDGVWQIRQSWNPTAQLFMNVCRFILSSDPSVANVNKMVAISLGGYDTHANQLRDLPRLISELAGGLHGLLYTIRAKKPCLFKKLSIYIMSEFGRTIRANAGLSTDHGWASVLLAIFGSYAPIPREQRLDRELGPEFILTSSPTHRDSIRQSSARMYARDLSRLHIDLDPMHLYPKVSMHSALALILSKALSIAEGNLATFFDTIMERKFYSKNYIAYENQRRLWTEFLEGIPGWS